MDEPAFPQSYWESQGEQLSHQVKGGMSLRDWFAGQALAGLLSTYGREGGIAYEVAANWSYAMSDAMLAEREKK